MRIETTGAALRAAAGWAARIVATKPTSPVLGCALLDAVAGTATIQATDLNLYGSAQLAGSVLDDGRIAVSSRLLSSVAEVIPTDADVTISGASSGIEIRSGRNQWGLPEIETELWPAWPDPGDLIGTIPAPDLRRAISRVQPAVSKEKEQPQLQAMVFAPTGDNLELAATDRYRVAHAVLPWTLKAECEELIIPGEVLKPVVDALKSHRGDVLVTSDGSTITFEAGPDRITGRLQAKYLPWRTVLPDLDKLSHTVILVDVAELRGATAGAAVGCKPGESLALEIDDQGIRVTAPDPKAADTHSDVLSLAGSPITVHVTPSYLLDALSGVDEATTEIRFNESPSHRFLLRPADDSGTVTAGYWHVLMPRKGG